MFWVGECLHSINFLFYSLLVVSLQLQGESVYLFFPISSETAYPSVPKFWGMHPLGVQMVIYRPKTTYFNQPFSVIYM